MSLTKSKVPAASAVKPIINANNLITLLEAYVEGGAEVHTPGSSGKHLLNLGLLDVSGDITPKGQAHIKQLLNLYLPVREEVWMDGQGNMIPL